MKRIILAGGCFWGVEAYFQRLKGVVKTTVGYTNGNMENPTYEDLKKHRATHAEACEIYYDETIMPLEKLLTHFFRIIDPTSLNQQGMDIGLQYRTGIYYTAEEDLKTINEYIEKIRNNYARPIVVEVQKEKGYYLAEEYHQDYLDKNPQGYCHVNLNIIPEEDKK
ncbi:MAG: peptide-methionine (S)-S-oxide reductase MsrA [Bacilli bacterium]|jgi:peptide-methionine (S)-S-oxide reductase|nr:peptide-methionine (S)-S-oxide reductase MsrA [Acholeplasmataceae bacterium]